MRSAYALAMLAGCTGMRPAVEQAQPEIAETAGVPRRDVRSLGDGCYVAGRQVWTCSIDSLPAGQRVCATEPDEQWRMTALYVSKWRHGAWDHGYYEPHLDSFIELQNTHRCHRRLYDAFRAEPVTVEVVDATISSPRVVPFAELGLVGIASTITLSKEATKMACLHDVETVRARSSVCVDKTGKIMTGTELLRSGFDAYQKSWYDYRTEPIEVDLEAVFANAKSTRPLPSHRTCAVVDLVARRITCRRP